MVGMGWGQEEAVGTVRHTAVMNRGPASLEQDPQLQFAQFAGPSPHWAVSCRGSLARISRTGHGQPSLLNICPDPTSPHTGLLNPCSLGSLPPGELII